MAKLICITGPDGAGKTTLVRNTADALTKLGRALKVANIWDMFFDPAMPRVFESQDKVQTYLKALSSHCRIHFLLHCLQGALDRAAADTKLDLLIFDAYWYKYMASEIVHGTAQDHVLKVTSGFAVPETIFNIVTTPELATSRKESFTLYESGFSGNDAADFLAFQARAQGAFYGLVRAQKTRIVDLDAKLTPEALTQAVVEVIDAHERVAIIGMDGSGKSTLAEALRAELGDVSAKLMRCPDFHETGDVPHADLSRQLSLLSKCADDVDHKVLKFASLYLRMTLFGPVEAALLQSVPRLLIQERHALVDALVFNGIYAARAARDPAYEEKTVQLRAVLDAKDARAFAATLAWLEQENARLGLTRPLKEVSVYCADLAALGPRGMLDRLVTDFSTSLPDRIFFLDVSTPVAVERLRARGGKAELHEHPKILETMRQGYLQAFSFLATVAPSMQIEIVSADTATPLELKQKLLQWLGL